MNVLGINLDGAGSGHLVENNRVDGSTWVGIGVEADGSVVRGNRIMDTGGGTTGEGGAVGILTQWDVEILGNLVSGVYATSGTNGSAIGIHPGNNMAGSVMDNNVKNLVHAGTGLSWGIGFWGENGRVSVDSNNLVGQGVANSRGIRCTAVNQVAMTGNIVSGFENPAVNCAYDDGNIVH